MSKKKVKKRAKSFIYHLRDPYGNLVDYVTSGETATELLEAHEMRLNFFLKQGWKLVK